MERELLTEFRPLLPGLTLEGTKSLESFQNNILRPVIKFQQGFLKTYFEANSQFKPLITNKTSRTEFQETVKKFIGNQPNIKHQLIGSILGLLTENELEFYWKNQTEVNKRIHQMICQRIADTFY